MTLHKRHNHGRVFRGLEARELLAVHKRDSHSDAIRMHVPAGFEAEQKQVVQTAISVVYVTLPQTFSGPALYSTITGDPNATPTSNAVSSTPTADNNDAQTTSDAQTEHTPSTSVATVTPNKASSAGALTTLSTTTAPAGNLNQVSNSDYGDATVVAGTPVQATHSPSSGAVISQSSDSSGMTGGARAGLAIGIILAIALAAGLIFFCWRRKKNAKDHEELTNEKHGSFADAGARRVEAGARRDSTATERVPASLRSTRTASTAPRLSLRPVTQFLPNLGGENRKSGGNTLSVAAAGLSEKPRSAWERQPSNADRNPFADAPVLSEKQGRSNSPPANPFDEPEGKKSSDSQEAIAAAAVSAAGLKHSPKSSWEGSEPPTPRSTNFGTAAAVPVGAGGMRDGAPPRGPNNVHRVQLDFKPSMDDELELRSGQLVRMLHEYDDGWALCIRMDRSQQGVAPRTCLSKLPVKPRPQGPPPPNSRPGTAQSVRGPPSPPQGPNGQPTGAMYPRPLTPTQTSRSPSPTEATTGEASTTPGGVVPPRKPVPGQAM